MFEHAELAPADPILGLSAAFAADPAAGKINLGAGVYKDETGVTPVLDCVREAERRLLEAGAPKVYLPIEGDPRFDRLLPGLVLGELGTSAQADGRCLAAQAPGGTGALRVAAELLAGVGLGSDASRRPVVWLSDPSWENHQKIFRAAGLELASYRYFDHDQHRLDTRGLLEDLGRARPGDAVVLHACCHNPSGADPSPELWSELAELLARRKLVPVVDFAYQGFADGPEEDRQGLMTLARRLPEVMVCNSFSKTLGLYNERIGGLTLLGPEADGVKAVLSQAKGAIRASYSNPPAHGSSIVVRVHEDPELKARWFVELATMRERIRAMRRCLQQALDAAGIRLLPDGNEFILRQRGMFSFTGLTPEEVDRLRRERSIYMVRTGRINVASLTEANIPVLVEAIAEVRGPA